MSKYFLASNESGDYYLVKANHREDWEEWSLSDDYEPDWAVYIDGIPDNFEFEYPNEKFKALKNNS